MANIPVACDVLSSHEVNTYLVSLIYSLGILNFFCRVINYLVPVEESMGIVKADLIVHF